MVNFSIHDNPAFWVLWLLTLLVCVHQIVRSVRTQAGTLGFVPVVCTMFGYLYLIQSAGTVISLGQRINSEFLAMGQLVALISLLSILAGWYKGCGKVVIAPPREMNRNSSQMLWYGGVTAIFIGTFAQYFYYFNFGNDYTMSAYLSMMFHVAFPGFAICTYLASYDWEYRKASHVLVLLALGAIFLLYWVYFARRGPTFTYLVVVVYGYYLARPRAVNRVVVLSGLGIACVAMLFLVMIRNYTGEGSWTAERLQNVSVSNVLLTKALQEGDNEFLYHCCAIATCMELDRYQWGTSYLSLTMHWIPRQWWPEKPALATGWFDPPTTQDIYEVTGVLPTVGSAITGVAESFSDFYWLTPVFWFAIGWCFGWLYRHTLLYPMSIWAILYVGLIAATHYLITQGFAAFFVPACIYVAIPIGIFTVSGAHRAFGPKKFKGRAATVRPTALNQV
jgi:hypothetical protein